ncbi:hypothetical protein ACFFK0_30205 [Paenibacillus chartarius]|uniref:Uncharacterized protein n=1 Tax=Paenibacillus chartarius TaxID=747481 RepID=A0ABV6DVL0_9BACL
MMYGTKLLDTDMDLLAASLSQKEVLVWSLNEHDVYVLVDQGLILKYDADAVIIRSTKYARKTKLHIRDHCEFSVKFKDEE